MRGLIEGQFSLAFSDFVRRWYPNHAEKSENAWEEFLQETQPSLKLHPTMAADEDTLALNSTSLLAAFDNEGELNVEMLADTLRRRNMDEIDDLDTDSSSSDSSVEVKICRHRSTSRRRRSASSRSHMARKRDSEGNYT